MAEEEKLEGCRQVLERADEGSLLIVTSALTLSEVLMLKNRQRIPVSDRQKVDSFFRNDYITIRNVTRRLSESARSLVWDYRIQPKDALHVATAMEANVSLMNTFDDKLIRKCKRHIQQFGLRVERPCVDDPKLNMELPRGPKKHK